MVHEGLCVKCSLVWSSVRNTGQTPRGPVPPVLLETQHASLHLFQLFHLLLCTHTHTYRRTHTFLYLCLFTWQRPFLTLLNLHCLKASLGAAKSVSGRTGPMSSGQALQDVSQSRFRGFHLVHTGMFSGVSLLWGTFGSEASRWMSDAFLYLIIEIVKGWIVVLCVTVGDVPAAALQRLILMDLDPTKWPPAAD